VLRIEGGRLPTSAEVASALLEAASNHKELQGQYIEAWANTQVAEVNTEAARLTASQLAYASGSIDGKNKERRDLQLELVVRGDQGVMRATSQYRDAQRQIKLAEIALESARVYRGVLHDIARLVMAENMAEANRGLGSLYGWGQE